METRELFERLIADEPPMSVSARAMSAGGRDAARRQWAGRGTGAVAAAAVVALGAVQLTSNGTGSAPSNGGATPSVVVDGSFAAFAFTSQSQVSSASGRSFVQLLKAG